MRNAVLTILGATVLTVACADSRDSAGDLTGPQFNHIIEGCRGSDILMAWTEGVPPDANLNGLVCQKSSGPARKETLPTYYDDITHIKERLPR